MSRLNRKLSALRTTELLKDKWWVTLLIPYLVGGIQILTILILGPSDYPSWSVYVGIVRFLSVAFFVTLVVSIFGLYFDIIYVAEYSEWEPSMWYSLMFFTPVIGIALRLHYLYKRSEYVGLSLTHSPQARG